MNRIVAALVAGAACLAGLQGQLSGRQAPREQRPTFRAEANYVRLDVYPLAGGEPVQDLRQEEFEVFEDGVPQEIATFEHVLIRPGGPPETRIEPSTAAEARQMAADPRARLFVVFLDTYHVSGTSGLQIRGPLLRMLDRAIGQDDLVAVMTPEMSGAAVTFGRRTAAIEAILDRYWDYGKRWRRAGLDPDENMYDACYPPTKGDREIQVAPKVISPMAQEMIDRRREKMTLDALEDLVVHLEGLREERKAVFVVSDGWRLFRPNSDLAGMVGDRVPGRPTIDVGPDGRMRSGDYGRASIGVDKYRCDQDRIRLAQEDHELQFRRLMDLANRANAAFYPVDPRGLPVFDAPMEAPDTERVGDQARLESRQGSLRNLASATDGLAILNSNDIDAGLRRVVHDLSSYYLVGYYSTNSKPDGRFRGVSVRVKRPGVTVRTRRGYLAPTPEEVAARSAAAGAGKAAASPLSSPLAVLARARDDAFVHAAAGYEWTAGSGGAPVARLWVVGELDPAAWRRDDQWKQGAAITVTASGADGDTVGERELALSAQARSTLLRLPATAPLAPGQYSVKVTAKPVGGVLGTSEVIAVVVPAPPRAGTPAIGQPQLLRRGPFSGAGWQPAGDLRFRRQERVKLEITVVGAFTTTSARLLDRNGNALTVPVTPAGRQEGGVQVVGGEVALAPLAAGDYVFEATIDHAQGSEKIYAAFRIIN
ncbi:MAG TPA: VWA domain-containing protein [Vicinamibacterales bacterium]|nr:VWA domain-containing protein [Vicinamibacterales bacterium]